MGSYEKAAQFAGLPVIPYQPATGLVLPVMPRTELRPREGPDQFWAIALDQHRVTVWSGKVGTDGKKQARRFASPASAQEKYRELVAEKVAAGWAPPPVHREFHRAGRSPKFWTITVSGTQRTVLSGKAGTEGTAATRSFKTEAAALEDCERLIARRVAEGYVEQQPAAGSLREALVAAIRANPDDAASRNAFADYLSEQGEQLPAAAWRVDGDRWAGGGFANLQSFLADPAVHLVEALVVGCCWGGNYGESSAGVVEALIAARGRLPNFRALFLGDILRRENEISWILHSDITGLLAAFPNLEHFRVRGGGGLVLRALRHDKLRSLVFEASNLSREVVRAVGASKLPALEHLEIWLGTDRYGADTTPADLKGILQGKRLPSLRYLGLRNSEIADDVAVALSKAPVPGRLRVLDLSLGTLTDAGAEALLAIPALARLEKLDIHHHYVSPELVAQFQALGIEVDASDPQEAEDFGDEELYRFVAHSE
jgi:uncharacterized protein (TIGR02996 family)